MKTFKAVVCAVGILLMGLVMVLADPGSGGLLFLVFGAIFGICVHLFGNPDKWR